MERTAHQTPYGRMVAWRVPGSEPPVLCLHGAGVSSRELLPLLSAWEGTREAWSVDLPGFGASEAPAWLLGVSELVESVVSWRARAGLHGGYLLGCSFGCQLAILVALRLCQRIDGLVLVGPTTDPTARSWHRQVFRWVRNSLHEPPRLALLTLQDYRDARTRRVVTAFSDSFANSIGDALPHIDVPVLVVRGEYDTLVPQAWAEEVTRQLRWGRLETFPNTAHMVPFAQPTGFAELVEHWLTTERAR